MIAVARFIHALSDDVPPAGEGDSVPGFEGVGNIRGHGAEGGDNHRGLVHAQSDNVAPGVGRGSVPGVGNIRGLGAEGGDG